MGQTFFLLSCFGVFMMADRESRISVASWSIRRLTLMLLRTGGFKTFLVVKAKTIKRTNWRWISYNIMLDRKPSKNIQLHFEFTGDKNKDCKMSVMHKFKELYQGAKNVIYRATGIMIVSWEEFFFRWIAKRTAEDARFHATSYSQVLPYIQKYKFNTPKVARTERSLHSIRNLKVEERTTAPSCKCCGNKHPFTQSFRCPAFHWKKCNKCKKVWKDLSAEG